MTKNTACVFILSLSTIVTQKILSCPWTLHLTQKFFFVPEPWSSRRSFYIVPEHCSWHRIFYFVSEHCSSRRSFILFLKTAVDTSFYIVPEHCSFLSLSTEVHTDVLYYPWAMQLTQQFLSCPWAQQLTQKLLSCPWTLQFTQKFLFCPWTLHLTPKFLSCPWTLQLSEVFSCPWALQSTQKFYLVPEQCSLHCQSVFLIPVQKDPAPNYPRDRDFLCMEFLWQLLCSEKVKVKCTLVQALRLCTGRTAHRGNRGIALPFHEHGTRRGWVVSLTPRPLFTLGKDPVSIVQEAGWAPGPVCTGAEKLAPTGTRSPDRPARSQSPYWLSYPAHRLCSETV